jgi:hypothetical protein
MYLSMVLSRERQELTRGFRERASLSRTSGMQYDFSLGAADPPQLV